MASNIDDARAWTRAVEFAGLEIEVLRIQAILSDGDCSAQEAPFWQAQLDQAREHLAALARVVMPAPAREAIAEWLIPEDVIAKIWADLELRPDLVAELFTRFLVPDLTWPAGARQAKADCPFCAQCGGGHGKQNFELELATTRWNTWCCAKGGNLRTALRSYSGLRFRDLMIELGAYVGIAIEDPQPRRRIAL